MAKEKALPDTFEYGGKVYTKDELLATLASYEKMKERAKKYAHYDPEKAKVQRSRRMAKIAGDPALLEAFKRSQRKITQKQLERGKAFRAFAYANIGKFNDWAKTNGVSITLSASQA